MGYSREISLTTEKINEMVKACIEYREVSYENGIYYGILKDGSKFIIKRDWIKIYMKSMASLIASNDIENLDLISVLYAIDQDIFRIGWNGIDEEFPYMCERIINSCKIALKNHSIIMPNDVVHMLENSMKYDDQKELIDGYVLQLLNENVLTNEVLNKAKFFSKMSRDELVKWCIEGKISVNTLTGINNIKGITPTQVRKLAKLGFFKDSTIEKIEKIHKNGFCNLKGIIELQKNEVIEREQAVQLLGGIEEIARTYRRFEKNKNRRDAKLYFDFLQPEEILSLYINKKLTRSDLEKITVDKNMIEQLSEEDFLKLAEMGFPKGIEFSSEEILERYAESDSGKTLLSYYTPKVISKLLNEGKIDLHFIDRLDEKILQKLDEKEREEYLNKLKISQDVLMDMYLEGNLSEEDSIKYFNKGIFGIEELSTIYGDDYSKIIELIKEGALDERTLVMLSKEDLEEGLLLEELTAEDVFKVYSKYNGIKIEDLQSIFDQYEEDIDQRVNVVNMIDEDFDPIKIREMFIYDILTHSDILELKERGIITEEQSEEIAKIDREKLYKELFKKGITSESDGKEDTASREYNGRTLFKVSVKEPTISSKKREEFFEKIGKCDFRDIEARDTKGREAPFRGYQIVGFPEYGVVVFENFDKVNNATYIMTLQELKSFVEKSNRGLIIFRKSKGALREEIKKGRAVRVRNHSANWGHNIIEAMKELSKEAREGIDYQKQTKLADMMRQEFVRARIESIGGKANPLAEMLVETSARVAKKRIEQEQVQALEQEVSQALENKEEIKEETKGEAHGEE